MAEKHKFGTSATEKRIKRQVTADVFKPGQHKCSYAIDTRHFTVVPDHSLGVKMLAKQIVTQEDDQPLIHGVPKEGVDEVRGRNVQCSQEIGGVTPSMNPFENGKDLRKLLGIFSPYEDLAVKRTLDKWIKEDPLAGMILTGEHYCKTIPLVVTSQLLGGCQTVLLDIPGCRFSGKAAKHFHSAYLMIGPALKEDPLLVVKYYSFHRAYCTMDLKISFMNMLRGSHPLISENLQLLFLLMLVSPVSSTGQKVISNYPPVHREVEAVSKQMLCGKDPKDYCLKMGKKEQKARSQQRARDGGDESSSSEGEEPTIPGLNYRETRLLHKAAKKLEEKGKAIFHNEETRQQMSEAFKTIFGGNDGPDEEESTSRDNETQLPDPGHQSSSSSDVSPPRLEREPVQPPSKKRKTAASNTGRNKRAQATGSKSRKLKVKMPSASGRVRQRKGLDPRKPVSQLDAECSSNIDEPESEEEEESVRTKTTKQHPEPTEAFRTPRSKGASAPDKPVSPDLGGPDLSLGDELTVLTPKTLGLSKSEDPSRLQDRPRRSRVSRRRQ